MIRTVKLLTSIALAGAFIFASNTQALVIDDGYNGNDTDGATDHSGDDVIGGDIYEIFSMSVTFSGDLMQVIVNTNYDELTDGPGGIDRGDISYGDLFISTDGWNPNGTAVDRYDTDNASNGEDWEYAFDTDAGVLRVIEDDADIILVDAARTGWRNGQEATVSASADALGGSSSFSAANAGSYLTYIIDFGAIFDDQGQGGEFAFPDEIGLRWEMTCANDVIEGVAVPEPASIALLGLGLLGLGMARRKATR